MRALLDANIFISFLLTPDRDSPVTEIVRSGILGRFVLLLPEELMDELAKKAHEKRYLAERITPVEVEELVDILSGVSEFIPKITEEIPAVTRDPKDDYLLAYALVGQADYLITGDDDLLVMGQVENIKIVTAHDFWEVVKNQ